MAPLTDGHPRPCGRWRRYGEGAILAAALVAVLVTVGTRLATVGPEVNPPGSDARSFYLTSRALAEGNLTLRELPPYYPPLVFLLYGGLLRLFALQYASVIVMNLLLYCGIIAGAYLLCRRVPPLRPARLPVVLFLALNPDKLHYLRLVAGEVPAAALLALFFLAYEMARTTDRTRDYLLAGCCFGLALLFRANLAIGLVALWLARGWQMIRHQPDARWRPLVILTIPVCLFLFLNAARNYQSTHRWVPLSTSGLIFMAGNNPYSDGVGAGFMVYYEEQLARDGYPPKAPERIPTSPAGDRYCYRLGWRYLLDQPAAAARNLVKKALLFWSPGLHHPGSRVGFLAHLVKIYLILWGLIQLGRSGHPGVAAPVLLLGSYFLFHAAYLPLLRYKYPVDFLIYAVISYALVRHGAALYRLWRPRCSTPPGQCR